MRRFALVLALGFFYAAPARADLQACLDASEKGQQARKAGHLREAREKFLVCGAESCPALIKKDCSVWQSEIAGALPSVTFGAKDESGRDLFDVTISMDGEVLTKKLDGKGIPIDPGPHTFKFETAGHQPVTQKALVKEGERTRVIDVKFDANGPVIEPGPVVREHTIPPWIVVGVGAAAAVTGVVVLATSPSRPSNCDASSTKCTRLPGESDSDFKNDQDTAGRADSQPTLGAVILVAGLAVAGGGLLWHFLEPTGPTKETALRIVPWTTGSATGVTLGARF